VHEDGGAAAGGAQAGTVRGEREHRGRCLQ
jgi:hypothetical protein